MDADSEISENKLSENKSILSLNYIYKRIILKENTRNIKSNLTTLNYENIAKFKMKNMNLNFLLNSIYKFKKSLKKNNPLLKYIKNVKLYDYTNLITLSNKSEIIKEYMNNKQRAQKPRYINNKEKILNFDYNAKNYKNFYFSRMSNIEHKKSVYSRKEKIILIQKYIRGFLRKKILDEEVNKIIVQKFIDKILLIQKNVRKFLYMKKSLSNLIVNIIQKERMKKSNKLTDIFSLYHYRNFYKKQILISQIIKIRHDSILLIQKNYRAYIFIKKVKEIIKKEKKSFALVYPYPAENVKIKIFMGSNYKIFEYTWCPIRHFFVLYLDKNNFNSGEYLCNMIINGNTILDKRYKYFVDKNNTLYNLIYIGDPIDMNPPSEQNLILNDNNNIKKEKSFDNEIIEEYGEEEEESSDDFYYYCYNDNSNSTNSYSTKSDKNQVNKNNKLKNEFNNKIPLKKSEFDNYFKSMLTNNKPEYKYSIDSQSTKKESSIQSQKFKYNNILDELCQSVSSSRSNFSLKNINLYSKKTHQTKYDTFKKKKVNNKKHILK